MCLLVITTTLYSTSLFMNRSLLFISMLMAAILGGIIAVFGVRYFSPPASTLGGAATNDQQAVNFTRYLPDTNYTVPEGLNFVYAANSVTPAVVFIRSSFNTGGEENPFRDFYEDFLGGGKRKRGPSSSSGSGVIVSSDGLIATNNHVIEDADFVEVTLNDNRTYRAEVIGRDPTTDLALIKIEGNNLSYVKYGDSDELSIGEWVLAIGNPFGTLTSTVTAGIVSAKARNINILRDPNNRQVESFIQTDAAVNRGNSGGALVNLKGELIGINTAIATPTGTYTGYSFAVPVSLVSKVMEDLLEYGTVQRALLGVEIRNVNADLADREDLEVVDGVYVSNVNRESAAELAGILPGDIIIAIDGNPVTNVAELQELVARNRPGDEVEVTYLHDGQKSTSIATLQNTMGNTEFVKKAKAFSVEGATFGNPSKNLLRELELEGGAQIIELESGKWSDADIGEGFIITSIDKEPVRSVEDMEVILDNKQGGILIEGMYPDGTEKYYGLGM